jgi:hypothetical protein
MATELVPSWRFKTEGLAGYIAGGHEHGLHWTEGVDGGPVTRPMCMNLEHYYARSERGGRFVPRYKAEVQSERTSAGVVIVRVGPCRNWNLDATISFRFVAEHVVEARYDFLFHEAYWDFEAFISNYFHAPAEPLIHLGGAWVRPRLGEREHRYWARNGQDARVLVDGRLDEFLAEMKGEYSVPVDALRYDVPVMITPVGEAEAAVVHFVERAQCPSLSANRTWNAHDFSLIGGDVHKGETVTCRAWMAYMKLASPDEVIPLYEQLTGAKARLVADL